MQLGREVYNANCYFCHGYNGDAETVAAGLLTPRPRDFTRAPALGRDAIEAAIRDGRPDTAMKPFAARLTGAEISAVADFVETRFVACGAVNTHYHTAANGWTDHEARYGPAFPFATGELPVDGPVDALSSGEQAGLALFRSACTTCHFGRASGAAEHGPAMALAGTRQAEAAEAEAEHHDDYETPTIHDFPPEIDGLTPTEAAGRDLYQAACAECHAADGTGLNWIGKFLHPPPTDFTSPEFRNSFDAARFAAVTAKAPIGTTMPSFATVLTSDELAAIAAYVRRAFVDGPHGR